MKTIAYTTTEEIKAIVLLMVLTFAFLVSSAQIDIPDKPAFESLTTAANPVNRSLIPAVQPASESQKELFADLKTIMNSEAYWSDINEEEIENVNLLQILTEWMKDGLYWEENQQTKSKFDERIAENEMNHN